MLMQFKKIPKHVAIIMDGNRRWARKQGLSFGDGHKRGAAALTSIIEAASEVGVKVLTVYAFSTENWSRPRVEIALLMELLKFYLVSERDSMVKNGVRLESIGDLTPLPEDVKKALSETKAITASGNTIQLVLALNYGGRDDLKRAMVRIVEGVQNGLIRKENLTEDLISNSLDTAPFGDPDLLIRPSGEKRMSNFLLWQISYAEVFLTEVLWPDFTKADFYQAITDYQTRDRRLGV